MKRIAKLFLFPTLLLVFFACENNTEDLNLETEQNNTLYKKEFSKETTLTPGDEQLLNIMQWTSYITAEALHANQDAESEFITTLASISSNSSSRKVRFNDLFIANNPEFMSAFETAFLYYEANDWEINVNDVECGKPRGGRPIPPPSGGSQDPCDGNLYCKFMNAITNVYCLEFYLPRGYQENTNGDTTITSTAHPLDTNNANYSYVHPGCQIGDNIIDNSNLKFHTNPLVTRPFKATSLEGCYSNEYPIDFTEFLEN